MLWFSDKARLEAIEATITDVMQKRIDALESQVAAQQKLIDIMLRSRIALLDTLAPELAKEAMQKTEERRAKERKERKDKGGSHRDGWEQPPHHRRGHWRTLRNGVKKWIEPTKVNMD